MAERLTVLSFISGLGPTITYFYSMLMLLMTGMSGAGKTTLANGLQSRLAAMNITAEVIDGDQYRATLNKDLGFSAADRRENISRLSNLAYKLSQQHIVAIVAAIAPFEDQRLDITLRYNAKIVWIKCALATLMERDTKGLYKKAMLPDHDPDKLWNLSGVNDLYDPPQNPHLAIDTSDATIETSIEQLLEFVLSQVSGCSPQAV